ncbi:sialic acid-binding Ig-like lectin 12 [Sinocyclocheilus anshuiensis]|uniref:sialic acid-binding Ig-like lectin 12 n=1 Tax=Sinocyclocheilus anshuiensis TaxID=1608454 RepID=UPI0007B89A1D|nr:PREDICTED: sialic acid-binding Ig-like lectin 12 [Sinocyclocheilus anshuiensis]
MDCTAVAPGMPVFSFMVFLFLPVQVNMQPSTSFDAKLPGRINALRGSCVQIPCTFDAPENTLKDTETIFGFWLKKHHAFLNPESLVVFNGTSNIIKGFKYIEILGNLSQRECTTVFYDVMNNHTDNYYFRVEMKPENWKYTYDIPIYISVSDVPELPILTPTDLQEVMEETTVNLSCSSEAPCPKQPPTISWSNIPESARITTQLQEKPDKTQSVFSYMTFKASYKDHKKNISCTATYPRNTPNDSTAETTVMLRVLFSPKETHIIIDPSDSISVGTNVTLTCKSKASPNEMNYTWYKRGQEKELDFGEQLTFNVNRRSEGWYFCTAKNIHGNQMSEEFQLIVAESLALIIGCVGGIAAFLFIFLLVTIFVRVQRVKASIIRETDVSDQGQEKHVQVNSIYANRAFVMGEELEMPKDENDMIHYGEIDFSTPQTKSTTEKISGQETIYAEVCGSGKD